MVKYLTSLNSDLVALAESQAVAHAWTRCARHDLKFSVYPILGCLDLKEVFFEMLRLQAPGDPGDRCGLGVRICVAQKNLNS